MSKITITDKVIINMSITLLSILHVPMLIFFYNVYGIILAILLLLNTKMLPFGTYFFKKAAF